MMRRGGLHSAPSHCPCVTDDDFAVAHDRRGNKRREYLGCRQDMVGNP
jgi:hypothetical protein